MAYCRLIVIGWPLDDQVARGSRERAGSLLKWVLNIARCSEGLILGYDSFSRSKCPNLGFWYSKWSLIFQLLDGLDAYLFCLNFL